MMKRLFSILLIAVCISSAAQYKDALIALGVMTSSIVLDAMGDSYMDSGHKPLGHSLNAVSIGVLVASPFILKIPRYKWPFYFASYVGLRIALFDPLYNVTRGLPLGYIGTTSVWDNGIRKLNSPPSWILAARGLCLVVSISIPLKEF